MRSGFLPAMEYCAVLSKLRNLVLVRYIGKVAAAFECTGVGLKLELLVLYYMYPFRYSFKWRQFWCCDVLSNHLFVVNHSADIRNEGSS